MTRSSEAKERPTIQTARLVLRPFTLADAPVVQALAGDKAVASTTLNIPHPYEDGLAEKWIAQHQEQYDKGEQVVFAVVRCEDRALIGAIGLTISQEHARAELGYWIGVPYWNQGYCTEAARAVIRFGFETLGLNRIHAFHLRRNPASGRVMRKAGMLYEGCRRQHVKKWGVFEDLEGYGILRSDYEARAVIRPCTESDFEAIYEIVNDAAQVYRGVIPADRWHEPYMPREELQHEIDTGVRFWGYEENGTLIGVMGIQDVQDVSDTFGVALIRHAYVRTARRGQGIGGRLLAHLRTLTERPVLIGTWAAATWAIRFYEKHDFRLVSEGEKNRLLRKYWSIPERQVETSVVLAEMATV